jgi:hypothetical protein
LPSAPPALHKMGLIRTLLGLVRPPTLDDPFFGRLVYMKMRDRRLSYWEATRVFAPTGQEIDLFIRAPAPLAPPNEAQRAFYQDVADGYADISAAIEPKLRLEVEDWLGRKIDGSLDRELSLTSFSVPVPSAILPSWEMSFASSTDPDHLFTATLRGREVLDVAIDG